MPEKSKGVIVFAFNTDSINYVKIADRSSQLIQKNLKLPITLVTDSTSSPEFAYDKVIRVDSPEYNFRSSIIYGSSEWRNKNRYTAYELSPYDKTILVDSDYLVFDDSLLKLLNQEFDYRIMSKQISEKQGQQLMGGPLSLQFMWATVVIFSKSDKAKALFDLVGRIQRNYQYYRMLFNARGGYYRNDFAFAMANIIVNGYCYNNTTAIPWRMITLDNKIVSITPNKIGFNVKLADRGIVLSKQNLHILDKQYLLSDEFGELVKNECST